METADAPPEVSDRVAKNLSRCSMASRNHGSLVLAGTSLTGDRDSHPQSTASGSAATPRIDSSNGWLRIRVCCGRPAQKTNRLSAARNRLAVAPGLLWRSQSKSGPDL